MALPLPPQVGGPGHLYLHDGWLAALACIRGRVVLDDTPYVAYRQHDAQYTGGSMARLSGAEPRAPRGGSLVSTVVERHPQLLVDFTRVTLVTGRLRESGTLSACRPAAVRELLALESFLRVRMLPRGLNRRLGAVNQLVRGRYSRYARGLRTALKDLA